MTSIFIRRTPAWRYIVVWGVAMALGASLASWRKPNATKADPAGPPSHPWIKAGHDASPSCPSPSDTIVGEGARTPEALLQAVLTNAPPPPDPYNDVCSQLARQDASLRTRLLERFRTESDPQNSRQLGAILTSLGTADVSAFSVKLARSADPHERVLGLKLLGGLQSPTPDTQRAITLALATETNPEALSIAVAAAAPGPMRAPEEVAGMVERMQKLAQHESADVRAAALISLARWGGPAVSEPEDSGGLSRRQPEGSGSVCVCGHRSPRSVGRLAQRLVRCRCTPGRAPASASDGARHAGLMEPRSGTIQQAQRIEEAGAPPRLRPRHLRATPGVMPAARIIGTPECLCRLNL
ncbi:MAG: hypothetical protein QM742_18800 [Aquabacterium sp.]